MATLCLPKSPCRRPLRASPARSRTASFCPAHSSCLRPIPTVLLPTQGKVETPRREGPMSAHPSSVLIGSFPFMYFFFFFSVRIFLFLFPRREVILSSFPPLCINSVDLLSSHLLYFVFLVSFSPPSPTFFSRRSDLVFIF